MKKLYTDILNNIEDEIQKKQLRFEMGKKSFGIVGSIEPVVQNSFNTDDETDALIFTNITMQTILELCRYFLGEKKDFNADYLKSKKPNFIKESLDENLEGLSKKYEDEETKEILKKVKTEVYLQFDEFEKKVINLCELILNISTDSVKDSVLMRQGSNTILLNTDFEILTKRNKENIQKIDMYTVNLILKIEDEDCKDKQIKIELLKKDINCIINTLQKSLEQLTELSK